MNFKYIKELDGWFLTIDDEIIAYYDFFGQKFNFCGKIVDSEGRKYTTDNKTKHTNPDNYTTYTEEKLVD